MANNAHFISNRSPPFASGHANRSTRARGTPLDRPIRPRSCRIFGLGAVVWCTLLARSECAGTCRSERGRGCASHRTTDVQRRRRSVQVRRTGRPPTVLSATGFCARLGRCARERASWRWSAPPTRKVWRRTDYLVGDLPALPALVGPHRQRAHRRRSRIDRSVAAVRVSQSLRQGGPARTRPVVELRPQRIARRSVRRARTHHRRARSRRADSTWKSGTVRCTKRCDACSPAIAATSPPAVGTKCRPGRR